MRKRIMGVILAVSLLFAWTPHTVMAAKMEGKPLQLLKTAEQTALEAETEPEATGQKTETKPKTESEVKTESGAADMEGDGTKSAPYRIGSAEQLRAFAELVNGVNGAPVTEACAALVHDIDLSDVCGPEIGSWMPIGTNDQPYTGTFDGSSFVITGLFYNELGSSYAGLFGRNVGTIKNLGIAGADITAGNYTGGVCGYNNGIITGCYHAASVKGVNYTGGICGYNDGGGTVSVCYNTGTVSGSKYVGGICGYNKNNAADCYNMGPVTGDKTSIGGICGYNKASVSNCFNTGSVVGGGEKYVGSICGYNHSKSTFSNCYYLITGEEKGNYGVAMSKEHFTSGEVCWLLNGGKSENVIWFQTCGLGFPTFGGKTVYQVQRQKAGGRADEMIVAYTNEKENRQAANNVSAQENPSDQNSGDHAHEHSYQEPEWEWEEYRAAKAVFTCQECGEKIVLAAAISDRTTAATCAAEGKTVYTASVEKDGKTYQDEKTVNSEKLPHQMPLVQMTVKSETCEEAGNKACWICPACGKYFADDQGTKEIPEKDVVIPAMGHHYVENGNKPWVWNIDSNPDSNPVKASLNLVCDRPGCGKTDTMEAQVTSITDATCEKAGETTYTAVVKIDGQQSFTDERKVSGKPIPHSYGEPVWEWKNDFTACTAMFTCTKCRHSETKSAVIDKDTTLSTCFQEGETTYKATVTFEGSDYVCPEVKRQTLAKTQHRYSKEPEWEWTEDFSACTAIFTCDICGESTSEQADVTETPVSGKDCGTPGKKVYKANVTFENKTYTCPEEKEKVMPATHTLTHVEAKQATCEDDGYEEYWKCSVCPKLFADAAGNKEISAILIIQATGHKLDPEPNNPKVYLCSVCHKRFTVTEENGGTKSITEVESEGVITQEAPTQADLEEETENVAPQSIEEQDGESEAEPVREETPPQPIAEENADQPVGERGTESSQEKQNEQNEENDQDGQRENLDGIMDASEHAARYGMIYPEREAEEEEHAVADVREESVVKLRAESKGNAVPQAIQDRQESPLWGAVVTLLALTGIILTLLFKGRRTGIRKS